MKGGGQWGQSSVHGVGETVALMTSSTLCNLVCHFRICFHSGHLKESEENLEE